MFRTVVLTALVATGSIPGLTPSPAAAQALAPVRHPDDHADYRVYVRQFGHWRVYRTYDRREDADRAARHLERRGYVVRVECVRRW